MKRALVIGIGSPIISDDAIGIRVAEEIMRLDMPNVDVEEASVSGLDMIEKMLDHERVIIVDAIVTKQLEPGDGGRPDAGRYSARASTARTRTRRTSPPPLSLEGDWSQNASPRRYSSSRSKH